VFTGKSKLDDENISIEEFINTIEDSSLIKKLIRNINGRFVAIGYNENVGDREHEVESILKMIENMNEEDFHECYKI
jgi:hypothetical protein